MQSLEILQNWAEIIHFQWKNNKDTNTNVQMHDITDKTVQFKTVKCKQLDKNRTIISITFFVFYACNWSKFKCFIDFLDELNRYAHLTIEQVASKNQSKTTNSKIVLLESIQQSLAEIDMYFAFYETTPSNIWFSVLYFAGKEKNKQTTISLRT